MSIEWIDNKKLEVLLRNEFRIKFQDLDDVEIERLVQSVMNYDDRKQFFLDRYRESAVVSEDASLETYVDHLARYGMIYIPSTTGNWSDIADSILANVGENNMEVKRTLIGVTIWMN